MKAKKPENDPKNEMLKLPNVDGNREEKYYIDIFLGYVVKFVDVRLSVVVRSNRGIRAVR